MPFLSKARPLRQGSFTFLASAFWPNHFVNSISVKYSDITQIRRNLTRIHRELQPAMVITAEFDPLRDEGVTYTRKLQEASVGVKTSHYEGLVHGFFAMASVIDLAA
jgi:acetyl esterase/lipase